jgi:CxxC motif-containing protein
MYLPGMNTEAAAYCLGEFNTNGLVTFTKNEYALIGTKWEIKKTAAPVKEIPVEKLKEYKIELSATNEGEKKVKINITTNFPDGTNFSLWLNRNYYVKGEKEPNGGELGDKELSVKNGKIETIVTINDTEWYNRYQKVAKAIPNDFPPIVKISDIIDINVMYTPARTQPENVVKILGTRGEFVTGKGAKKFGTGTLGQLTSFSVSKELNMPFKK